MVNKVKISFFVPEILQNELRKSVIASGYGMRGKSRWIVDAIISLLKTNNFLELINIGDDLKGFEKSETIVVEDEIKKMLDKAVWEVRKKYPIMEGVQSKIVRTAIVHKLLKS
jgi:hypothetical protein